MKNLKNKLQNNKDGFTLIELLVVVAIIAILALIVLLALNPVEMARRSRDSRRLSDLGTIRKSIDLALADGEALPDTTGEADPYVDLSTAISTTAFPIAGGMDISKYLSVVPNDPYTSASNPQVLGVAGGVCSGATATPADLKYEIKSDGDVYVLRARLESEDNCSAITDDGNGASDYYEIGTDPGLDL